jgi:hypothetical protein
MPALTGYLERTRGWSAGWSVGFNSGFGDALSFGVSAYARSLFGIDGDEGSTAYTVGNVSALFVGFAEGLYSAINYATRYAASQAKMAYTGASRFLRWGEDQAAEAAYEIIRNSTDDVAAIARNTGLQESWIQRVKEHVFIKPHQLDDAARRFDASEGIANAWRRLELGEHTANDVNLLRHELFEARFEGIFKSNYRQAHQAALDAGYTWLESL